MYNIIKRRDIVTSIIIAFISIYTPGVGHVVGGQFKRGIILFLILIAILIFSLVSGFMKTAGSAIATFVAFYAVLLYIAADSFIINSHKEGVTLKWYNQWYFYIILGCLSFFVLNFVQASWGYIKFTMKTNANVPSLQIGDLVLAEMNFGNTPGLNFVNVYGYPQDVYIIHAPKYTVNSIALFFSIDKAGHVTKLVRRIVAASNDDFQIKSGQVYLNGKLNNQLQKIISQNLTLKSANYGPIHVPKDKYLIYLNYANKIADNFELVPFEYIQGRADLILWSTSLKRIGQIKP